MRASLRQADGIVSTGWLRRLRILGHKSIQFGSAHNRLTAFSILCLALLVRSLYVLTLPQTLSFDEPHYHDIVSRLLTGQGYSFSSNAFHTAVAGQPTSWQEPAFPLFLSVLHALFGLDNYLAVRLFHSFVGALIPVVVFLLGEKAVGRGIGVVAGLFLVVQPSLIYFSGLLMTETLLTLLIMTGLYMLTGTARRTPSHRDVAFGMLVGIAVLTRAEVAGFLPISFLWLWLYSNLQQAMKRAILIGTGCAVFLLPWTARNYMVHRAFVPMTTKTGYNLYVYNFPVRDYDFNDRWDVVTIPDLSGLNEIERSRWFTTKGLEFIRQDPVLFLDFALHKLVDFWNPVPKTDNSLFVIANAASFGWVALLTLAGLLLLLVRPDMRRPSVVLFYALVGLYVLKCMVFTGGMKARLPVEPLMVLLAVFGVRSFLGVRVFHRRLL